MRFSQRASLNGNCVLRSTEIARFSQRASLNENCVLPSTEIVCFAQRKLCASPNALRSTEIVCFAQRKLCASPNATFNAITFSSYSYKRISVFTVTIVWTVLHICHCCHYMSLIMVYTRNCPCHEQRVSRLYTLGCDTPIFSH